MKKALLLGFISLTLLANTCEKSGNDPAPYTSSCENAVQVTMNNLTGLDGCGWLLTLADGTRLEPINLDSYIATPVEGEKIWASITPRTDLASICMVGPIVEITCVDRVQE